MIEHLNELYLSIIGVGMSSLVTLGLYVVNRRLKKFDELQEKVNDLEKDMSSMATKKDLDEKFDSMDTKLAQTQTALTNRLDDIYNVLIERR